MSFTAVSPPVFEGINYQVGAVRMEAYLDANDLQEAVEQVYEVPILSDNPTVAQIKNHKKKKQRASKEKATLFVVVSPTMFYRIMTLKTAKEIWDFLKGEYKGNEKINVRLLGLTFLILELFRKFQ